LESHARARTTSSGEPTSNAKWLSVVRDAVMIGVEAQEDHAARHHAVGIAIAHPQPEHVGVEAHRGLEVGDVEHHVTELAKLEHDGLLVF